jgi:hypothetical protein
MKILELIPFVLIAVVIVFFSIRGKKKTDAAVQAFAQSNGYTFNPKPDKASIFNMSIFAREHSLSIRDGVTMPTGRIVVCCSVIEGTGYNNMQGMTNKNHNTEYIASITAINGGGTSFNLIPKALSGMFGFNHDGLTRYQLEGNLSEIYELYVSPGEETETLTVLQPDTLLQFSQNSPSTTLIARPGALYVFLRKTINTSAQPNSQWSYDNAFQTLNTLTDAVLKNYHQ